jgi:hypothetical protein
VSVVEDALVVFALPSIAQMDDLRAIKAQLYPVESFVEADEY